MADSRVDVAHLTAPVIDPSSQLSAGYKPGKYLMPGCFGIPTAVPPEGTMTMAPIYVAKATTFDRIQCNVSVAGSAGAVVRLGIYGSDADGMPYGLVLDAGTVAATSTGVREATISQYLPLGKWWLAAVVQGAATTRPTLYLLGANYTRPAGVPCNGVADEAWIARTGVSGALPNPGPPTASYAAAIAVAVRMV